MADKLGPYISQLMATVIESDDEFVKDFQENYLVLTLRLMDNAVELITAK